MQREHPLWPGGTVCLAKQDNGQSGKVGLAGVLTATRWNPRAEGPRSETQNRTASTPKVLCRCIASRTTGGPSAAK